MCEKGLISELRYSGLIPRDDDDAFPFRYDYCSHHSNFTEVEECTEFLDQKALKTHFQDSCTGKQECKINPISHVPKEEFTIKTGGITEVSPRMKAF